MLAEADPLISSTWRQALSLGGLVWCPESFTLEQLLAQFQFSKSWCSSSGMHRPH